MGRLRPHKHLRTCRTGKRRCWRISVREELVRPEGLRWPVSQTVGCATRRIPDSSIPIKVSTSIDRLVFHLADLWEITWMPTEVSLLAERAMDHPVLSEVEPM